MPRPSRYAPDSIARPVHWSREAACLEADPSDFFPKEHGLEAPFVREQAKAYCRRCPVRERCLRYALDRPEKFGVWGGLDEDERQSIRRSSQRRTRRKAARSQEEDADAVKATAEPAEAA
ncbi:WhiB family transcriptional regulator [Streptomyces europaeiscabiei]|uniref:WhiB family transcriptional regulator n=1 Tax=Streptomyces europaeiscabiei TaxID=146819 RepID=UPI002E106922|nr:WhiB family transcriptional regulator [Streptomyces europaeiscabiei]